MTQTETLLSELLCLAERFKKLGLEPGNFRAAAVLLLKEMGITVEKGNDSDADEWNIAHWYIVEFIAQQVGGDESLFSDSHKRMKT